MKRVLFSPVGTADPITALGDGPVLHIVRHYRPDVVVLVLSCEISQLHRRDARYTTAIERLAPGTEVRVVQTDEAEVHRFDRFIPAYRQQVIDLAAEFPGAELLLNVSSGTPAMQSALVAINAFGIPATKAIQVSTPSRAMNRSGDREDQHAYDLDLLWEANDDNDPARPNRCLEVSSADFGVLLQRQNLKQLVKSYNYTAAATIVAAACLPGATENLVRGAAHRSQLDHRTAPAFFKGTELRYDPADKEAEYVAALALLAKREQWAEFVRATTPAITAVLKSALAVVLPEADYLDDEGRVDRAKLVGREDIRWVIGRGPNSPTAPWFLYSKDLLALLAKFAPTKHVELKPLVDFERKVRNIVAHEIVSVRKADITGPGVSGPDALLRILAKHTRARLDLYDRINELIVEQVDNAPIVR